MMHATALGPTDGEFMATLIFVHGTGVRGAEYIKSLELIKKNAAAHGGHDVVGVPWGDEVGVRLLRGGASIPNYRRTRGASVPVIDDVDLMDDLWLALYLDPLFELRLLGGKGMVWQGLGIPPGEQLRAAVSRLGHSSGLAQLLAVEGREAQFSRARERVMTSAEFDDALKTMGPGSTEHPFAVARAIVAFMDPIEDGDMEMTDIERDELTAQVANDLGGHVLGMASDFLESVLVYAGSMLADPVLTHRRGKLSDKASPATGDVLAYTLDGSAARAMIADQVRRASGPAYLLGHSLGGIMCVDLLCMEDVEVAGLITVGSQAPYMYEVSALRGLAHPEALPETFPRWLNVYDDKDVLSYLAGAVFGPRVQDQRVNSRKRFPAAHSAYWTNPRVWEAIQGFVA